MGGLSFGVVFFLLFVCFLFSNAIVGNFEV